jgi:hypothetical protein
MVRGVGRFGRRRMQKEEGRCFLYICAQGVSSVYQCTFTSIDLSFLFSGIRSENDIFGAPSFPNHSLPQGIL